MASTPLLSETNFLRKCEITASLVSLLKHVVLCSANLKLILGLCRARFSKTKFVITQPLNSFMVNQSFLTAGCNIHLLIVRFHMQHNLTAVREMLTKLNLLFISLDTTPNSFSFLFFFTGIWVIYQHGLCWSVALCPSTQRFWGWKKSMFGCWRNGRGQSHCSSPTAEPLLFHLSFVSSPFSSF